MTCIAAYTDGRTVWMAADSQMSRDRRTFQYAPQSGKLFRVPICRSDMVELGDALVGGAGVAAAARLMKHEVDIPFCDAELDDDQGLDEWAHWCAVEWTEAVMAADPPIFTPEMGLDALLLFGFAGRVWMLSANTATRISDGSLAIGSGDELARGALEALAVEKHLMPPEQRLELAVRIACKYDDGCCEPVVQDKLSFPTLER